MTKQSRRKFLKWTGGILGTGILAGWIFRQPIARSIMATKGTFDPSLLNAAPGPNDICVLTSTQTEGPFYFPSPERVNITEGRPGKTYQLNLQILNHPDCTPIEGAVVEIWHCDAEGNYSGYPEEMGHDAWKTLLFFMKNMPEENAKFHIDPTEETKYLRGLQRTNANGWVTFDTILPGWYEGRVPHIHARVVLGETDMLTTQLYFNEEVTNDIYTSVDPYIHYGKSPLPFSEDNVLVEGKSANGLMVTLSPAGEGLTSYSRIGVKSS